MNYAHEMRKIDEHRAKRYAELIAAGYDLSNTYTTQEGVVFGMTGATCSRCPEPSKLSHRTPVTGYFVCPACGVMYDEPNFDCDEFITNVDDDDDEEEA